MDSPMSSKDGTNSKGFSALITYVRILTSMNLLTKPKLWTLGKPYQTHYICKVSLQHGFYGELQGLNVHYTIYMVSLQCGFSDVYKVWALIKIFATHYVCKVSVQNELSWFWRLSFCWKSSHILTFVRLFTNVCSPVLYR